MIRTLVWLSVLCLAVALPAQEIRVTVQGPSPGVVRLGESAQVELRVIGTTQSAEVFAPDVDGLTMRMGRPSTMKSQSIVNGRIRSLRYVTYQIVLTPTREGVFEIPEFEVRVAGETHPVRALKLEAVKDLRGEEHAFVEVNVSAPRVYVHEPIHLDLDFGVNDGLRLSQQRAQNGATFSEVDIQAAWLDELDGAVEIEDEENTRYSEYLVRNGRFLQPVITQRGYQRDGRSFHRYRFTRSYLPTRSGEFRLVAPMLRIGVEVGRPRRGLFGETRAGGVENYYAYGEPVSFEVLPIPEEGRPADYYGGVGRFTVSAKADKRRVKVGNSLKLTLSIEGQGNTEFLNVPELAEIEGFHLLGKTEQRSKERVQVTYDVTPLDDQVTQVPPIEWNYFDTTPGVERFRVVRTDPLPIEVVPLSESESLAALPGEERASVTPGVDDIFDMKRSAEHLPAPRSEGPARTVVIGLLLAPWLLFGVLLGLRGRRARLRADVSGQRARGAQKQFQKALAAGTDPADALVSYLAARLDTADAAVIGPDLAQRLTAAGVDEGVAAEVQSAIEAATAARYGGGGGLEASAASRLVEQLETQSIQKVAKVIAGLWLACIAFGATATAQSEVAEAAYRNGDYAAAAEAFEQAFADSDGDARLLYNLGNSYYRLGELPKALVAYERARLGMPRDRELLANVALVRQKLELGSAEGEPFLDAVADLRSSFTAAELVWLCLLFQVVAAGCLVLGWRRGWVRGLGFVALVPGLLLAAEILWLGPSRPPAGIVLANDTSVVAEPREGMEPVMTLRAGVEVSVVSSGPAWTQVAVEGRRGYVPATRVGIVE